VDTPHALRQFEFYAKAPPALQRTIEAAARTVVHSANATVFRAGAESVGVPCVASGSVRVFRTSATGRELTLYRVTAGQTCFVSVLAALLARPIAASATAESPVEAWSIPAATFRACFRSSDSVRDYVVELIGARMVALMDLAQDVAFRRVDQRLAEYLYARFTQQPGPERALAITHEQIASQLGTAREVVSRLLRDFEVLGAVSVSRARVALRDELRLRCLVAGDPVLCQNGPLGD
jgi:CRP/FNR family transcriptional regulator, anaerobic regulatory protein